MGGEAIIGNTGLACASGTEGGLRYNTTSNCVELCDGSGWTCIAPPACADSTPNAFAFTDLSQDGHTDWYLPAKDELNVIYGNNAAVGNFDTSGIYYWSSVEYDFYNA